MPKKQGLYRTNKEALSQEQVFQRGKIENEIALARDPHEAYAGHKKYTNTYERFMREQGVSREQAPQGTKKE